MSANYDIFPSQSPSDNATFAMLENPSFQLQELFPMSQAGIILTAISGVLSTICSMITLNIIRLSNQRLTTTHHRIMAFMSVFDIMASVCMALTTLPMPSDEQDQCWVIEQRARCKVFSSYWGSPEDQHSTFVCPGTLCVGLLSRWTHTRSKNDWNQYFTCTL